MRVIFVYAYNPPLVLGDMNDSENQESESEIFPWNILVVYRDGKKHEYQHMEEYAGDILPFPFGNSVRLKSEIGEQMRKKQPPEKKHYNLPSTL